MFKKFYRKHESFLSTLWYISLFLGYIYAIYRWFVSLFLTAHDGNFLGFVFLIIFQTFILGITGIISAVVIALVFLAIGLVPYLIVRGLTK